MPKEFTPSKDVLRALYDVALEHARLIPGADVEWLEKRREDLEGRDEFSFAFSRHSGAQCRLTVGFDYRRATKETDEDGKQYEVQALVVTVNWLSGGTSPVRARAAIDLYSAVTSLACLLESVAGEWRVGDEVKGGAPAA